MILIIGGAYQGKQDYARETYQLQDADIFLCKDADVDFSCKCIDEIEEFTYACLKDEINPLDYFKEHESLWKESILICDDIFCGVVPLGAELRQWRQETGRLCKYLSQKADHVIRIFCGLEQQLK